MPVLALPPPTEVGDVSSLDDIDVVDNVDLADAMDGATEAKEAAALSGRGVGTCFVEVVVGGGSKEDLREIMEGADFRDGGGIDRGVEIGITVLGPATSVCRSP